MPKTVKVKMTNEQLNLTLAVLDTWQQDSKLCDLIEVVETQLGEDEVQYEVVFLKVSGEITYDLWEKFCQEIEMNIPFPSF